ncbi:hypothetical protein LAZ67_13002054 [Cordylochernes scorpioides]|uniref:Tc1-like transposase DDE domain-containing protein n=1 Tax=Cordylochernes scorpioides TaxID=51811 RepID=A0ABY6L4B8_9ARAC|nr:hypothetical protein LAZ67_13002054 [Cordylochernes scorpioides]
MDWPARSPDLNPIEHVWDALGRRIGARHPSPRTLAELRTALLEEWGLLPLDLLQSLVNSMRARWGYIMWMAGDMRANSNPYSMSMAAIFMRFHNYIATQLNNSEWDDETLFQESRQVL